MNTKIDVKALVDEVYPEVVKLRRDVHRYPELAFQEIRTAELVAQRLEGFGLKVTRGVGKTGVVGLLEGNGGGKTLLIRADMDGLPVGEANQVEYRSQNPGVMHA